MRFSVHILSLCVLSDLGLAAPSLPPTSELESRQLVSGLLKGVDGTLEAVVGGLLGALRKAIDSGDRDKTLDILHVLEPSKTPRSVKDVSVALEKISKSKPKTIIDYSAQLIVNGLISGNTLDLFAYAKGLVSEQNGSNNKNRDPPKKVYPKVADCDAPYTTSEAKLRAAIHIPPSFTYGEKPPVILFPGTGSTGFTTFRGNFIPLLTDVEWADPVWVNVPVLLLEDAQVNAEYAAYALNYIASLTKRDVAVIAWSQGNIDVQWALKYWPSARKVTTDHVAISADYKGTILANIGGATGLINTPAVLQQEAGSTFINTLRSNDGDSGYIPTTSLYSSLFDEVVQPQAGTGASAYILDARNVGVTNAEVQEVCAGKLGGSFYTHESMLANPLTFALAKDALTHQGPGNISRIDLVDICNRSLAPGLGLEDLLITENAVVIAALSLVLYLPKQVEEPKIKQYAFEATGTC
ncbi:hypothetical protein FVEN_g937 [Fusarium venenatum]|uniref:Lipase B n=1 Tax=Fusarium venenatum TaxID=56646 RepID=A0A2L2TPT8_9HYPO|nr:uncharacterized protein FVRRES_10650 [Fusarium venenatum]KAG8361562.1 hypothetical protein FVEN_g937 [Fusarium venenatum]KAH6967240.1 hypothetical protein EDB82DRAFT_580711 [Fusarium venenatum]CEI70573.1 unnamed protein product [Fusarium venenatum]